MNYSENNTLIIGWNNISDLFISKRLDKSQAYSVSQMNLQEKPYLKPRKMITLLRMEMICGHQKGK